MTVTISGSNGIAVPLGSVSAPGVSNTTSATTGVYNPTSTSLAIATNGVNALTINASQALGVGSSPSYGTSGQVLTSAGSGASPTWTTPAGVVQFQNTLYSTPGTYTWTAPTGVTNVRVTVIGAGSGGAASTVGAGGGVAVGFYTVVPGTGYTVTVGAASAGVSSGSSSAGGTSSFSSFISATGGSGATSGASGSIGAGSNGTFANSYTNATFYSGIAIPYFQYSAGSTSYGSTGSSAAKVFSPTWSATNSGGAGLGGSTNNGGVGGIVFLEYVG
jgi:hypothetical protein